MARKRYDVVFVNFGMIKWSGFLFGVEVIILI